MNLAGRNIGRRNFLGIVIRTINQDLSISQKFIGSVVCLVIIPMIFLTLVFYFKFQQILEKEVSSSYEQVVAQYVGSIDNKLTLYRNLLDSITVNGMVQDIFSRQDQFRINSTLDIGRKFSKEIDNQLFVKNSNEIYAIMLYALNRQFPSDGIHTSNVEKVKNEAWYQEMIKRSDTTHYFSYIIKGLDLNVVSLVKPIPDLTGNRYLKKLGFAKIDLVATSLFKMDNRRADRDNYDIYILDPAGTVLFTNSTKPFPFTGKKNLHEILGSDTGRWTIKDSNHNGILIHHKIGGCGWTAFVMFQNDELENKVKEIGSFILFIVLLMLLILICLTALFTRIFTRRTLLLTDKMNRIEKGELTVGSVIDGKDEIGNIDRHFNRMILRLNDLINENYIQKIEKREAELKALQFQINPHFLYNTLESISAIASVYGCREICTICEKLGAMFRYNINKDHSEFVPLIEEIQHIQNYLYIQKVRFGDKFTTFFDIPDELKDCKVLRFILQPLVENALYHGFEGKRVQGCLEISAFVTDGSLIIMIYDDGQGMTAEQVERINTYINENDSRSIGEYKESIGIKNVNSRIKLVCGEEYGITIKSTLNSGTQVRITLPFDHAKGDGNVQNPDCR